MASSIALWCIVCALLVTFARAEVTVSDLSGVWRGYIRPIAVTNLTPQGLFGPCFDTLPAECAEQSGLSEQTYTFNGTTVSYQGTHHIGILTREQSAARTPACAKNGIYPIETYFTVPPSEITSYDSKAERLLYIDARRPDEINCVRLRYRVGADGPYIEVEHNAIVQGRADIILTTGSSFVCERLSDECFQEVDEEGVIDGGITYSMSLTCIEGACLNVDGAAAPSAEHAPKESPDDV